MILIAAALLAPVIVTGTQVTGRESVASGRADACKLPNGWDGVTRARPRFVVFGETHGTREAPALVGEVACALAAERRRVLVAVELRATDDAAIQAAWRLPPDRFAAALSKAGWAGRDDGVASEAMMAMLVRLHAAKSAGRPVAIVAFDDVRDDAQRRRLAPLAGPALREAAQADIIRAAATAGRYDQVIVLTGNVHARKVPVSYGGVTYEPMAMRLARSGRLVSLNARTADGSEWGCRLRQGVAFVPGRPLPADAIACAEHPVRADPEAGEARSITLAPAAAGEDAAAYDGVFDLGPVTGSPPAVPTTATQPTGG